MTVPAEIMDFSAGRLEEPHDVNFGALSPCFLRWV